MSGLFQISEPTRQEPEVLSYEICGRDRIVAISQGWPERIIRQSILNRPVWDLMGDGNVADIYRALITEIRRTGEGVSFTFRCDDPQTRRVMSMALIPMGCGGIRFSSRPIEAGPQDLHDYLRRHQSLPLSLELCLQCGRIGVDGEWRPAAWAVESLGIFADDLPFRTWLVRCPHCRPDGHFKRQPG
jgi:hypothetical protein